MRENSNKVEMAALTAAVWIVLAAGAAGAGDGAPSAPGAQDGSRDRGDYQIGPEDVLDIAVWNNTAVSRTVPVRPDGKISLPLLNDVQAAGLTPMELRDVLTRRLSEYMSAPEVAVIVREVHSFKVTVVGQLNTPGRFEMRTRATVLDAIAQAGGFNEFASPNRMVILRADGGTIHRIRFRYKKALSGTGEEAHFLLKPGDTIVVP